MVETAVVERGEKITLPGKFLKAIGIKHNEKVVVGFYVSRNNKNGFSL